MVRKEGVVWLGWWDTSTSGRRCVLTRESFGMPTLALSSLCLLAVLVINVGGC